MASVGIGSAAAVQQVAAATVKEAARSFRWQKALSAAVARGGASPTQPQGQATLIPTVPSEDNASHTKVVFKGRYTNFPLGHIWEKYDFVQTHLLLQEALILQQGQQPELLGPEQELQQRFIVNLRLEQAHSKPLDQPKE
ncbi:hypothetical protein cyc_05407 [Cyclospora cayetanensis]|uniref:Uncharacterized protein n=1 Tax=Cyclospora cayetanensis TaxID=88456 RepID=A0A1D3D6C6_9EIME|nr:hypothetical protein cyc_05407 [Cyclospora cayetanensis]